MTTLIVIREPLSRCKDKQSSSRDPVEEKEEGLYQGWIIPGIKVIIRQPTEITNLVSEEFTVPGLTAREPVWDRLRPSMCMTVV